MGKKQVKLKRKNEIKKNEITSFFLFGRDIYIALIKISKTKDFTFYQSQVSILGPMGYGPTTLPLRHFDG